MRSPLGNRLIQRIFDPEPVNCLINRPEIRPTVGGAGYLDCTALLADRRNVCLMAGDNGALFAWRGPGIFEGHSFFTARGREAISLGRAMLAKMLATHARMIWGLTPVANRRARIFNRWIGMRSLGVMETPEGDCELFVLECN